MRTRKFRYFAADFETTVYEGQEYTEVWASAYVELGTEEVFVLHSIEEQFKFLIEYDCNICVYYHNLKFDGAFWIDYLLRVLQYNQAYDQIGPEPTDIVWREERRMKNKEFKYSVSGKGQWYTIIIKVNNHIIEIRDSLKLMPYSLKRIGEGFKTKHRKLEMEYEGFRYAGCDITDHEKEYISNDVLVLKEGLEFMFSQGHDKLTIGSCCLSEFKNMYEKEQYESLFPNLYDIWIDERKHGVDNAGAWILKSYKGGFCHVIKGKENKLFKNGTTADVNSLYPYSMHSMSGNKYPIGRPKFWTGNFIPDEAIDDRIYYFVRVKTRFYIKDGYIPFIQIKGNMLYKGTENLESSDVYNKNTKSYNSMYFDFEGKPHDTRVELTFTMTEYIRFREFYNVIDFEILDGCYFGCVAGLFDEYIDKYREIKETSTGAMREMAKLFSNNLYGKLAANTDSSFKLAYIKDDGSTGFIDVEEHNKTPGYIAIGSACTGYARDYTIRTAQANYYGKDKPGFIYADTDSIHCDLLPEEIKGIRVHSKTYGCWKLESCWDIAIFARQKTYIERVVIENLEPVESYYNIKGAGMPDRCKELLNISLYGEQDIKGYEGKDGNWKEWSNEEKDFLFDENDKPIKREITDFRKGFCVPGKLRPKRIKGGIVLVNTTFEMR